MKTEQTCTGVQYGFEEGETCRRGGCAGTMLFPPTEGCTCFVSAPCPACTSVKLTCATCGATADDDEAFDAPKFGPHQYADHDGTSDCAHGCGCWMGPARSGGPDGVDPFGECPKNPMAPAEPVDPITTVQVDATLAAYALNLLHGAELEPFERENLIAMAKRAGAEVTAAHARMALVRDKRNAALSAKLAEREALRDTLTHCRDQFRRYEQLHALKPDGAGQEKAAVNGKFAAMCDAALKAGA